MRFFDELPPKGRPGRRVKYEDVAELCRRNPHRWGLWLTLPNRNRASVRADSVKTGQLAAFRPAGMYEAAVRTNPDSGYDIWIRYTG